MRNLKQYCSLENRGASYYKILNNLTSGKLNTYITSPFIILKSTIRWNHKSKYMTTWLSNGRHGKAPMCNSICWASFLLSQSQLRMQIYSLYSRHIIQYPQPCGSFSHDMSTVCFFYTAPKTRDFFFFESLSLCKSTQVKMVQIHLTFWSWKGTTEWKKTSAQQTHNN